MLALGVWGLMKLLSAMTAATVKATVVKKPKTVCSRTSAECMVGVLALGWRGEERRRVVVVEQSGCRESRWSWLAKYLTRLWSSGAHVEPPALSRALVAWLGNVTAQTWRTGHSACQGRPSRVNKIVILLACTNESTSSQLNKEEVSISTCQLRLLPR